jgi:probable phosphoglycerate mutase
MGWPASCCGWVIRHGESVGNLHGLVQGQSLDEELTARGRRQASRLAHSLPGQVHPRVASSDLLRARQTAAAFTQYAVGPIEFVTDLRERGLGQLEGSSWDDVDPQLIGIRDGVVVDPDVAPAGGESIRQFADRVLGALARLASAHPSPVPAVVVAHGGVLRVVAAAQNGHLADGRMSVGTPWPAMANAQPLPCCFMQLAGARTKAAEELCQAR